LGGDDFEVLSFGLLDSVELSPFFLDAEGFGASLCFLG
jgi:hypothetical protein